MKSKSESNPTVFYVHYADVEMCHAALHGRDKTICGKSLAGNNFKWHHPAGTRCGECFITSYSPKV